MIPGLSDCKTLICIGNGGVGKTTLSAALAVYYASQGKRVLVLTIDPSRRLKDLLGLKEDGSVSMIEHPRFQIPLHATLINHEAVFSTYLERIAEKYPEFLPSLKNNKLFQQLMTNLGDSQEFSSLERLLQAEESGNYDLIVLDTPPSQHVIDFLRAPQKLNDLFLERIHEWWKAENESANAFGPLALFKKAVMGGSQKILGLFEKITGVEFISNLSGFFQATNRWTHQLRDRFAKMQRLLTRHETKFVLITSHDIKKLREAEILGQEVKKGSHELAGILINQMVPEWYSEHLLETAQKGLVRATDQETEANPWKKIHNSFLNYYDLKMNSVQEWNKTRSLNVPLKVLPRISYELNGVEALLRFSQQFDQSTSIDGLKSENLK